MKILVFSATLGVLLFLSHSFGVAAPRKLSLQEALGYALENSPAFDSARKTRSIRELEYKNAVAKMLPSVDFTTTNGLQNNIPIASTTAGNSLATSNPSAPWFSSLGLSMTENLYDNGVSLTRASIADLNRELASVNYHKAMDSLALDVASEFYRLSQAVILLDVRKQQEAMLDKQFKSLTSQYHQGLKTRSDYLRMKTQVQRAEIDRVAAENGVIQSESTLRKLIGISYAAKEPPSFEPVKVNRGERIEKLLPDRAPELEKVYDFRAAKIQEDINGKSVTLAKREYWPRLSLTSGVNYGNQNYLNSGRAFDADHTLTWNALVTLQYNIWDWGSRRRDVEIAEYNRNIQENSLNEALLDINARITALMGDIERVRKNHELSQELLTYEEESHRDMETRYREGKATYLDLTTEMDSLLDARIRFYTSYFDVLSNSARYRYYEGKLYESLIEK